MSSDFELLLFCSEPETIRRAVAGGVAGIVVDWELRGKEERQAGFDTQVNRETVEDLRRVRDCTDATIICRVNAFGDHTAGEVEAAIDAGADEIWLPMVENPAHVNEVQRLIRGRCKFGIMLETVAAVLGHAQFAGCELSRVYVGLNDLSIALRRKNVFVPVADGTLDRVRSSFFQPFGFGGLTLPDRGDPIPSRLLINEMARLRTTFTVLRRSFLKDINGCDVAEGVRSIRREVGQALDSDPSQLDAQHQEFCASVFKWHVSR